MQKNKHHFKTAAEIYAESIGAILPKSTPHKIDSFWMAYNSSRCKTAMLCISIIVTTGFIISESTGNPSFKLHQVMIILLGYWMRRTSKAQENRLIESAKHE